MALHGPLAHHRVAQVGEVRVVELDVAAPGLVQGGDLGLVAGGQVGEELLHVGIGVDVDGGPSTPEVHGGR